MSSVILYGHRGARGELPENTLPGFAHAVRHGIRHFELDLHLSRDGELMVIHDSTLDRTTGQTGQVIEFTASALEKIDARTHTAPSPHFCGIPRLREVLAACGDYLHMQLEVKTDQKDRLSMVANRLIELIRAEDLYDKVTLTSADKWFLQQVRLRDARVSTGLVAEYRFPSPVATAKRIGASYLVLNWKLCTRQLVNAAHAEGMHVSCWTVNRIHDMVVLLDKGADSIITDYPTSAIHYFSQHRPTR